MPEETWIKNLDWKKKIDEVRSWLIEETNWKELISKKHKKACIVLNSIDNFLFVIFQFLL